jgi:hypothetical protein
MTLDDASRRRAIRMQRFVLWLSKHWLRVVAVFFALYVGLPFAAPTLMKIGATGPAKVLYTIYSPMCHQFAFRSWFLFGEQAAYPRADAQVDALGTFEDFAAQDAYFAGVEDLSTWTADLQLLARAFVGNDQMGYKVALCERDIAIYGALLLFTAFFGLFRNKIRPARFCCTCCWGWGRLGWMGSASC